MKSVLFIAIFLCFGNLGFAQTTIPQLVSFSAVVRDVNNQPIVNTPVSIRLTFKEGGQTGPLVYCALHQDVTNQNGFISIQLNRDVLGTGCNGVPSTAFDQIPWENGGFWMEVEYQTTPGTPFENLGQLELASSFYAFASKTTEKINGVDFSGANDGDVLTYNITSGQWEPMPSNGNTGYSGDYNDLTNLPTIPTVPTNVSTFTNDAGYLTSDNDQQQLSVSDDGDTLFLQNGGFVIIPGISAANFPASGTNPVVITNPVTNITSNSATFSGSITNANGNQIVQRGIVFAQSPNPVLSNQNIYLGLGIGSFDTTTSLAYQYPHFLNSNTTYYVRAYAINQFNDTTFGNQVSFTTFAVGQTGPGGGIVFFNKGNATNGWQFLEVAPNDLSIGSTWGCSGASGSTLVSISGTQLSVGSGESNTGLIIFSCNEALIAAKLCSDLIQGGQNDWFLPSRDELNLIYRNIHLNGLGSFATVNYERYWSSSQDDQNGALNSYTFRFGSGLSSPNSKLSNYYVRAIRSF